ncbi:PWWP domain-containing DNA repair factor 3A-like [Argopecten irradians]|uniref:PWWP domain-containing DNA repair factor 3A-like n=1 Tax=Argopecten irradians TaxID=31199 RepID=UPI0037163BE4
MEDAECPYKTGDIVWVKIRSYPWWPAQVVQEKECLVYHSPVTKKKVLVHVKFLNESSFDDVTDLKCIERLDCPNRKLLAKKGLSSKAHSQAFRGALELAEKETGISLLPDQTENEKCSKKRKVSEKCEKVGRRNSSNKKQKCSPEATPSRKNLLPDFEFDSSPDISPDTSTVSKSLKFGQTKLRIKKNCGKSENKDDSSSIGTVDGSISPLRESVCTYDYSSTPGGMLSLMPSSYDSSFDLPTPTPDNHSISHINRLSFDPNLQKDLCDSSDSDTELPDALSPIVGGPPVSEKDIIMVRWKRHPFWPAYVKKVYKKGQEVIRISVVFIKPMDNAPMEKITMRYRRQTILPFSEKEKKKILDNLQEENSALFSKACELAEDYLDKRVLGRWTNGIPGQPHMYDSKSEDGKIIDVEDFQPSMMDNVSECSSGNSNMELLEDPSDSKELKRYEKIKARNENLILYIKSEEMRTYLVQIYQGKRKSERHTKYHSNRTKVKDGIRHAGFGPIADEEQQDDIYFTLITWYKEAKGLTTDELPDFDYVMDVWIPEAIIQALVKTKQYSRGRATEKFSRGVSLTKSERDRVHRSILESAKQISDEDWANHEEKRNAQLKELGINPVMCRRPTRVVKLHQINR